MFRASDYERENRKTRPTNQRISKKTKLDTNSKTLKHKCSQCERTDAKQYPISEKETRWLCLIHVERFQRKDVKERPNFIRGSQLAH